MEEAIKSLIVLGNTGIEVLDEMFICRLNGDQKFWPLSNTAAAKNCRGTGELGSPKLHQITGPETSAAHSCRHGKGTMCQVGEKKTSKKFLVLRGHFWSRINGYTVPQSLSVGVSISLEGM